MRNRTHLHRLVSGGETRKILVRGRTCCRTTEGQCGCPPACSTASSLMKPMSTSKAFWRGWAENYCCDRVTLASLSLESRYSACTTPHYADAVQESVYATVPRRPSDHARIAWVVNGALVRCCFSDLHLPQRQPSVSGFHISVCRRHRPLVLMASSTCGREAGSGS